MNAKKCFTKDCDAAPLWLPVMLLYADRRRWPNAPPARSICGIPCCNGHRKEWTLDLLLSDESFETIATAFQRLGKARPDRSASELTFISIDSQEAQTFIRGSQTH